VIQTMNKIVHEEPDSVAEMAADVPIRLQWMLEKCLAKDPARRYQHADDVIVDLQTLASELEAGTAQPIGAESAAAPAPAGDGQAVSLKLAVPIAGALVLVTALVVWLLVGSASPPPDAPLRFGIDLPEDQYFGSQGNQISLSPDGRHLVYREASQGARLHHRPMDRIGETPIAGTEGAVNPFFSSDSQWVAFASAGSLKKVNVAGGAPFELCSGCTDGRSAGSWSTSDVIVFSVGGALWQIAGSGGSPSRLAPPEGQQSEGVFERPHVLPDGDTVLATLRNLDYPGGAIVAISLTSEQFRVLIEGGSDPRYSPTGHIIYLRGDSLFAVPFDAAGGLVTEQPTPILQEVTAAVSEAFARFSLSRNGTLAYYSSVGDLIERDLVWVDRAGKATPITDRPRLYRQPRLSPDGRSLALLIGEAAQTDSVWIHDLELDTLTPFTTSGDQHSPVWSPDGTWIAFASDEGGDPTQDNIFRRPADRSQGATLLLDKEGQQYPSSFSPDGRRLFFSDGTPGTFDVWTVPVDDDGEAEPFLQGIAEQVDGELSPDGNWIAYESDESGQLEVIVEPYPGPGSKITISPDGGVNPVWSRDGRELFYRIGDQMRVVDVLETDPVFRPGPSQVLFEVPYRPEAQRNYDVDLDGQRFIMIEARDTTATPARIVVVVNWFEVLERLVPTGR
jgi:serine/threonine-protein kinase